MHIPIGRGLICISTILHNDKIASSLMKLPNNEKLNPSRYVKPYLWECGSAHLQGYTFSVFSNSKSPAGYFVDFQVPFRLVFPSAYPQSKVSTPSPSEGGFHNTTDMRIHSSVESTVFPNMLREHLAKG